MTRRVDFGDAPTARCGSLGCAGVNARGETKPGQFRISPAVGRRELALFTGKVIAGDSAQPSVAAGAAVSRSSLARAAGSCSREVMSSFW